MATMEKHPHESSTQGGKPERDATKHDAEKGSGTAKPAAKDVKPAAQTRDHKAGKQDDAVLEPRGERVLQTKGMGGEMSRDMHKDAGPQAERTGDSDPRGKDGTRH